ncbi:MAG: transcriptional regulator [Deltaproteobacteria bacterium]|jgi:DNA-binding transcriptional ArsR family regulator|nr:transcriptional regulator [Deltaproteobacteria bacterium]
METDDVVRVLAALAQETRLEAFRLLVQAGPEGLPAGEIAEQLDVPAPTLSFHLKALAQGDLVHVQRDGRSLFYAPNFATLNEVLAFLTKNCCGG